jgi:hypothetical protein
MGNKCTEMYRFEQLIKKRKKRRLIKKKEPKKKLIRNIKEKKERKINSLSRIRACERRERERIFFIFFLSSK